MKQKEAEIWSMSYHPADPLILLYNPIEKLKKMAEAASIPYTADQLLDIGLTVIRNTRDFGNQTHKSEKDSIKQFEEIPTKLDRELK